MAVGDDDSGSAQKSYSSLAAFYNSDARRLESRELDVGLWWRADAEGPLHRAAWVRETGELYLVRLGPPEEGGGAVEVLARSDSRGELEEALQGWREECGGPRSLGWLRARAAGVRARVGAGRRGLVKGPGPIPA
jgi:hypothetical protein